MDELCKICGYPIDECICNKKLTASELEFFRKYGIYVEDCENESDCNTEKFSVGDKVYYKGKKYIVMLVFESGDVCLQEFKDEGFCIASRKKCKKVYTVKPKKVRCNK